MKHKINHPGCKGCALCCYFPPDIRDMSPFDRLDRGDGWCRFLSEDKSCMIYEDRPPICNSTKVWQQLNKLKRLPWRTYKRQSLKACKNLKALKKLKDRKQ